MCTPTAVRHQTHPHNSLFIFLIVIVLLLLQVKATVDPKWKSSKREERRTKKKCNFAFFKNSIQGKQKNVKKGKETGKMLIGILTWIIIKWRCHILLGGKRLFGDEFCRFAEPISNCADFHEMYFFFHYCHLLCDEQTRGEAKDGEIKNGICSRLCWRMKAMD